MVRIAKRAPIVDEGFFLIKRILILKAGQRDMLQPMLCYVCSTWRNELCSSIQVSGAAAAGSLAQWIFVSRLIVGDKRSTSTECGSRSPRKVTAINTARMGEQAGYPLPAHSLSLLAINRANLSFISSSGPAPRFYVIYLISFDSLSLSSASSSSSAFHTPPFFLFRSN